MDHPTLTESERAIVEAVKAELSQLLFCENVPRERWSQVTLACVIEFAGSVLAEVQAVPDTERPPAEERTT